jgi:hypothetical protein
MKEIIEGLKDNSVAFAYLDARMLVPITGTRNFSSVYCKDNQQAVVMAPQWHEGNSFNIESPCKLHITPLKSRPDYFIGKDCPNVVTLDESSLSSIVSHLAANEFKSGDVDVSFRGINDADGHRTHFTTRLVDGYTAIRNALHSARSRGYDNPVFVVELPIDFKHN